MASDNDFEEFDEDPDFDPASAGDESAGYSSSSDSDSSSFDDEDYDDSEEDEMMKKKSKHHQMHDEHKPKHHKHHHHHQLKELPELQRKKSIPKPVEYYKGKPVCKFGKECYRKNPLHFAEFAHPHLDAPTDAVSPTDAAAPVVPIISTPVPPNEVHSKEEKCTGYVPQPSTPPDPEGVNMRKRKATVDGDESPRDDVSKAEPDRKRLRVANAPAPVPAPVVAPAVGIVDDVSTDEDVDLRKNEPGPLKAKKLRDSLVEPRFDTSTTMPMNWEVPEDPAVSEPSDEIAKPMDSDVPVNPDTARTVQNVASQWHVTPKMDLPETYVDAWDGLHIRLPCSPKSSYRRPFPNPDLDLSRWYLIQTVLSQPISSSFEFQEAIFAYNPHVRDLQFTAFHQFINVIASKDESDGFFRSTLPYIVQLALKLPEVCNQPIPLLTPKCNKTVSLTRYQIGVLLANAFLCTVPNQGWVASDSLKLSDIMKARYPHANFDTLFSGPPGAGCTQAQASKLRCFLHYFERLSASSSERLQEQVTFTRATQAQAPDWSSSVKPFLKVDIHEDGKMEDASDHLQVDFANKCIGGGALGRGCLQEEILFATVPELVAAMIFTAYLKRNEAIRVRGARRYASHSGYGETFTFEGDFPNAAKLDIVAIDATVFGRYPDKQILQYLPQCLLRDLNKCYCGFSSENEENPPIPLATGNCTTLFSCCTHLLGGCGAFGGYHDLKAIVQLMAAAQAGRDVSYYTFGVPGLGAMLKELAEVLQRKKVTVGQVWHKLQQVSKGLFPQGIPQGVAESPISPPQLFTVIIEEFDV